MRGTRVPLAPSVLLLLLLITCATLVGLSTCQRQGDSQQAAWSPSAARFYPGNSLQRSGFVNEQIPRLPSLVDSQPSRSPHSQSDSVEYYDEDAEYYDEDASSALPQKSQSHPRESQEAADEGAGGLREPKVIPTKTEERSRESSADSANAGNASALYNEDSYYYDEDYEEEAPSEEAALAPVKGGEQDSGEEQRDDDEKQAIPESSNEQEQQQQQQQQQQQPPAIASAAEDTEVPINRTASLGHNDEARAEPEAESEAEAKVQAPVQQQQSTSISPETSSSAVEVKAEGTSASDEDGSSPAEDGEKLDADSILIGEAIVSVVTTKSVVNGTFSVPETTSPTPPTSTMGQESVEENLSSSTSTTTTTTTTEELLLEEEEEEEEEEKEKVDSAEATSSTTSSTTEFTPSSTIQASVQTGRSVSGARFLPFPSVDKVEQLDSTESIIDKLDRVQSELSSGFLANGRFVPRRYTKKPFSATSLTLPTTSTIAPTSSPIPPITISSITKRPRVQTTLDDVSAFLPKDFPKSAGGGYRTTKRPKFQTTIEDVEAFLPKDFPRASYRTSSTARPKFQTTIEDVEAFLPKDFPRSGYRSGGFKRPGHKTTTSTTSSSSSTSTTTTTQTVAAAVASTEKSTASTSRKALEDINAFLPPGFKLKKEDATTEKSLILSEILAKTKLIGLKEGSTVSTSTTERTKSIQDLFAKSAVDVSALLPPGYKPEANSPKSSTTKLSVDPIEALLGKSAVDVSALLPPGYKPDGDKSVELPRTGGVDPVQDLLVKSKLDASVLGLLPTGFGPAESGDEPAPVHQEQTTAKSKVVFPSRPGGRKPIHKITTPASSVAGGAGSGGASGGSGGGGSRGSGDTASPRIQKGWPTRATTEFTGWPTSSTTPISIEKLLEAARTATISSLNVSAVPTTSEISSTSSTTTTTTTTLRPTTPGICDEDCEVAGTIKIVENATWVPELLDRNTHEWQDLAEEIEREMNLVFAKSPVLRKWFRNIRIDSFSQGSVLVDYFVELADLKEKVNTQQLKVIFHDSLRTFDFDNPMEASPKGPMKLGKFIIDPKSTDFVVIPRVAAPKMLEDENRLIPQWAIAVIVIGVGGLLFIIVFGVSVLVNRQHGSKLKPSISAMYEEEVSKNVMSHAAPPPSRPASEYQKNDSQTMWNDAGWHDKPFESSSHKILVDGLPYERKYNPYDSWKSEWNGYYYPPTQASGSNVSRHHPDYDINF